MPAPLLPIVTKTSLMYARSYCKVLLYRGQALSRKQADDESVGVVQVLAETLHCVPDHVLDAPPRRLDAYQQPIAGLTDAQLPHPPWSSTAETSLPASAVEERRYAAQLEVAWSGPEQESATAVEALQAANSRTHVVAVTA